MTSIGPIQGMDRLHALLRTIRTDGNNVETLFSNTLDLGCRGCFLSHEEQCLAGQRGSRRNWKVLTVLIYHYSEAVATLLPGEQAA